jgi:cyclophilin family peptidyl-prolyl cis-trans isomerase/Flp pilus assembly protein TadD
MLALVLVTALTSAFQDSDVAKKARADLASVRSSIEKLVSLQEKRQKIDEQLRAGAEDSDRPKKLAQQRQDVIKEFSDLRDNTVKAMDTLIATATESLKSAPDDPGLLEVRGEAYLLYNRDDEAADDLEKLVKVRPEDADLALKIGRIEQRLNRFDNAVVNLEKYLRKDPSHLETRMLLAVSYFAVHRFEEALVLFEAALKEKLEPEQKETTEQFRKMASAYVELWKAEQGIRTKEAKANDLPRVLLTTTKGVIELELFENEAPNTVANFIDLVTRKYYDGLKFHRVIPGFMAQGGCPRGDGTGDPGYRFKDELTGSVRSHFRGSLSMANSGPDTNGSQFFLTHLPTDWLNGKHTVFGRVLQGQDVVDRLRVGDAITKAEVTRKRDHPYVVKKLGDEKSDEKKPGDQK